ncbi:unnamed protein product [Callosobruchus maculatus]|uniref:RRM domain-containing protein n=1 Tax=Callosobruchus maculatus TaxID=64391 RepID=A0A653BY50_CALMS|nr:unnamed protein product [Callosobruchus maculatus]
MVKRFSDAARAYEECDKSYKAQFAELEREPRHSSDDSFGCDSSFGAIGSGVGSNSNGGIPKTLYPSSDFIDEACNKPIITRSPHMDQDQPWKSYNTIPSSSSYPHTRATNMDADSSKGEHKSIADSVAAELGLDKNQRLSGAQRRKLKKAIKMAEGTWREEKPYKKPLSQDCREEKPYKKPLNQDWREEKPSGVYKYPKEMSHQGIKRPRNDPKPELNTPKRSRQDEGLAKATSEDASNRMVVIHEQHPIITLDKDQADIILEKLGDILHKDSTSACPLQFLSVTFRVGAILMSCANEATVVWLRKAVASLKEDLTIVESKDLSKMPRVSVFIPEPEAENQEEVRIITLLGKQNPDLKVAWWHFLHSEKQEGKGVTMLFCIDEVSFTNLLNNQRRAFYRFGRVVFKVSAELGLDKNQKLSGAQRRKLKKAIKMAEGTWREEKPYKKPFSQDWNEKKPNKKPLSQDWREEKLSGVSKYPKEMSHQGIKRPRNDPKPELNTPKRSRQDERLAKAFKPATENQEEGRIITLLGKQNPDLKVEWWHFLHSEKQKGKGVTMFFCIDEVSFTNLLNNQLRAFYRFGRVLFKTFVYEVAAELGLDKNQRLWGAQRGKLKKAIKMAEGTWRKEKTYKKPLNQDWRKEKRSGVYKYPKEMSHQGIKRPRNDPKPPLNTPKRSRQDEGLTQASSEEASNRMAAVASLREDVTIIESKDLSKMARVSVFVPEPEAENQEEERIITLLGKQNPDLKVCWWHLLQSVKQEGKGVTMFFCIDEVSFTNLLNNQRRAFYRFGTVVFKVAAELGLDKSQKLPGAQRRKLKKAIKMAEGTWRDEKPYKSFSQDCNEKKRYKKPLNQDWGEEKPSGVYKYRKEMGHQGIKRPRNDPKPPLNTPKGSRQDVGLTKASSEEASNRMAVIHEQHPIITLDKDQADLILEKLGDILHKDSVTYIKYSKTSEAANALEKMHRHTMGTDRPIKVMVAADRDKGSQKDLNEEETIRRLFVSVPKTMTESELKEKFEQFGDVESAIIIKDRQTKESKGCGFVKFRRFSDAARAFEECDKSYRALFAEPKGEPRHGFGDSFGRGSSFGGMGGGMRSGSNGGIPSLLTAPKTLNPPADFEDEGYNKLIVTGSPLINQDQLWKLFNIVPTMEYCSLTYEGDGRRPTRCVAEVMYNDAVWAAYAREKMHGFEYPPGTRLIVR